MKRLYASIALLALAAPALAQGGGPIETIAYQGYLLDDQGLPMHGTFAMTFSMYSFADSPTALWSETHPAVSVIQGVFNVELGSVLPFTQALFGDFGFYRPIYLGIALGSDPELQPRTPLTSVPFAMSVRGWLRVEPPPALPENEFDGPNIIAGHAVVDDDNVGSTVSGGGKADGSSNRNEVTGGDYATVSGGIGNQIASFNEVLDYGTISGGRLNLITSGTSATIGGGSQNEAAGESSTIAGGQQNLATGVSSAIGGGGMNVASGDYATVSGGSSNRAGEYASVGGGLSNVATNLSVVPGGRENRAVGSYAFAAGYRARANHEGSFVWNSHTVNQDSMVSTAAAQFLVRAPGGVGIGTSAPATFFHLQAAKDASASPQNHIALIENNATTNSSGPDVLAIKTSNTNPGAATNLITFYDAAKAIGRIEGDGGGGITFNSGGADYAEYLPLEPGMAMPEPGSVVGVRRGEVSRETGNADRVMVVSTRPIVLGNRPESALDRHVPVAFVGQVPVRLSGTACAGDFLVPSGAGDGRARAVAPEHVDLDVAARVIGRVWRVDGANAIAEVGLDRADVLVTIARRQQDRLAEQDRRLARQEEQLATLAEQLRRLQERFSALEQREPAVLASEY